jgi:hypothetical protein
MSYDIRIGAGDIPAYTLLTDDSYKVVNWTRQADMTPADQWLAVQPNPPLLQTFVPSLELGSGDYYGKFASQIEFTYLTEDMRQYIFNTIMGGKPVAKVTVYLEHPTNGFSVYTGQLVTPYAVGGAFDRFDSNIYTSNVYPFQRGTLKTISYLLQENGDYLLQENGDRIVLEQQS